MRIAVDARPLGPPLTGIGVYTAALLERLLDTDHQWCLYADRALAEGPWAEHPAVRIRHGDPAPQSLGSLAVANRDYLRWAREDKVDLFWSPRHHLPFLLPASLPGVVTVHDLVWRRHPETMSFRGRLLERAAMARSLARASRIIAVSEFTAREIAHFYPAAATRCTVIHEAGRALGDPVPPELDFPFFLFVGTREPRKNLSTLIRAFAMAVKEGDLPHRLVLVGAAGWGGVDVETEAARLDIANRVLVKGYVDEPALAGLYAGATALVMPSKYEGFGLPVVEAMARGTPVIVSDRAALPEVAGGAGLLVDSEDPGAIAAALTSVGSDDSLRDTLSQRALRRAEDFSWDRAAAETLALLEAAASTGRS